MCEFTSKRERIAHAEACACQCMRECMHEYVHMLVHALASGARVGAWVRGCAYRRWRSSNETHLKAVRHKVFAFMSL